MAGLTGFPSRGCRPNQSYDESYSSDSDSYGGDARDQQRFLAEFQRQVYVRRFQDQSSSPMGMGGFQSPFGNRERHSPMMGGHPQFGIPSHLGRDIGCGGMGGMGFGMGMGPGMGLGMGMGMRMRVGMGAGMGMERGRGPGYPNRSPFFGPPMGYQQPSPFGLGHAHRSHPMFTSRHRQNGQFSWPQSRRSPLSTSLFDDDDDDESDYDTSSAYNHPRRRRRGLGRFERSPYRSRHRPGWTHSHYDRYEDYDGEDEEDDESDYEENYLVRRRRPRY